MDLVKRIHPLKMNDFCFARSFGRILSNSFGYLAKHTSKKPYRKVWLFNEVVMPPYRDRISLTTIILTLPIAKARGFLLPDKPKALQICRVFFNLVSPFLVDHSARYRYAITHRRAEHIAPYAVRLILLSPTYSVELHIFIAPTKSLCE